jgi:hypothetical protein
MLLKDYTAENTLGIRGISTQLCNQAVGLGFLLSVSHENLIVDGKSLVHLYLQPGAAKSLLSIVKDTRVEVSTAYRTLAQQFILKKNLSTKVAPVGKSDHGSGLSLDIPDYATVKAKFIKAGWRQPYADDLLHFDYPGVDCRSQTVLTFQKLWNSNTKTSKLVEDGDCGPKVLNALANSPSQGFTTALSTRIPLAFNDVGVDVNKLQSKLIELSYFREPASGIYSQSLVKAVKAYQSALNLTSDGVAGFKTLTSLGLL